MMTRRRNTRHEPIPFDLVIEILLRLPVKSISRFRIVSKQWKSTLLGPNFTESFWAISSSRTKILFTCLKDGETIFFSSPHPQKNEPSPPITANIHMSFPINCPFGICRPVRGLVCGLNQRTSKGRTVSVPLICNPSTGQSLALPEVQTTRKEVMSCFGYDPIDEQFSVLCMTVSYDDGGSEEHQLLTLGTEKQPSWKMIKCDMPHEPAVVDYTNGFALYDGICINGVLYYLAIVYDEFPDIACFDIRSEKFSHIKKADEDMQTEWGVHFKPTLVNYKGKLAKLQRNIVTGIQLWVLEDAEKHEWSSYIYVLPPPWKNMFEETKLCFVGTTPRGEIVLSPNTISYSSVGTMGRGEFALSPNTISDSFYLIYYNPESDTVTRVGIQGMEAFKTCKAYIFLDHVEDLKLMASV